MPLDLYFEDDQFPYIGLKETRDVARAILMDGDGHFAVHRLHGFDKFGDRNYFETPGGGVDEGETPEIAVIRECYEETGYDVEVVEFLGKVTDFYNCLARKNVNYYFLCKAKSSSTGTHFASEGDTLIAETLFLPIDEIIEKYESTPNTMLSKIVKTRELPVWQYVKELLNK